MTAEPRRSHPGESGVTGLSARLADILADVRAREAGDPEAYPARTIEDLYAIGLPLAPFSPGLGGANGSLRDSVELVERLASVSPAAGLLISMPLSLAGFVVAGVEAAPAAHRAACAAQAEQVAADYRAGRIYAACNSEKGAGGSLAATQTTARRQGTGFRLSGEKILASFGRHASHFFSTAKVNPDDLPGAGTVEAFFVKTTAQGVEIANDWDGFGMRPTESQTVRYRDAPVEALLGFPNYLGIVQPVPYAYCLFAAISLGCARGLLEALGVPAPPSPALRLRLSEALMRYEAARAYLLETADGWRPAAGPVPTARVIRAKTYVTQESTRLCAELFALSGGRHYRRTSPVARLLSGSFAGTALRPPLPLALDALVESFALEQALE
jgi:alkylation response protein AidB-like acyl-CoA dehydrogenase